MQRDHFILITWAAAIALTSSAFAEFPDLFDSPWIGFDASNFNTARYTYASTVADFDNDGDPDIATVSYANINRMTVLLNNGDGTYAQPDIYVMSDASYDVTSADFDGDGFIDIVAANTNVNWFGTRVSLFHNNGDGTFASAQTFTTGGGPVGLAVADFNNDGGLDLAVANWGFLGGGNSVSVLLNDGAGGFEPPLNFPAGDAPFRLAAADLDNDGFVDIAVANGGVNDFEPGQVTILMNNGNSGFDTVSLPDFFPSLVFFPTIAASDIDLDGDIDLLYTHLLLDSGDETFVVVLFENDGGGGMAPPQTIEVGAGFLSITVADVTGDGWPDILGAQLETERWTVVPSLGNGDFGPYQMHVSGEAPIDIETADVDGDGDLDPIVINRDSLQVNIHINEGAGEFPPLTDYQISQFSSFFDHGDIDNDGDIDIVNGASVSARFEILRNEGDGTFPPIEVYVPPASPLDVKLRDLNGDASLDLLWNEAGPPYRFGTAMNDGTGHFINGTMWNVPTCGYFLAEIDAFDLDNEGDLDIVQVENLGCQGDPFSSRRVFISENLGNGTFQLVNIVVVNVGPRSVAGGDFNDDGNMDLALTGQPGTILLGNGDFTFTALDLAMIPAINIAAGDLNADDILDLAYAIQRNIEPFIESMAIQLGNGDGTFQPVTVYLGSHAPQLAQIHEILLGDPDADGDLDVMALNTASNDVSFWANNGDGTFQAQVRYGVEEHPFDFSYADFTGDGIADLAVIGNGAPPIPSSAKIIPGRMGPDTPTPGDLDGDGHVGASDLLILLVNWGPCPPKGDCPADLNGDGSVGAADLLILLVNWG